MDGKELTISKTSLVRLEFLLKDKKTMIFSSVEEDETFYGEAIHSV